VVKEGAGQLLLGAGRAYNHFMKDAILLFNPAAGRYDLSPKTIDRLLARLLEHGIRCKAVKTQPGGLGISSPELCSSDLLLVYGGDGTIHQVIQQVAGKGVRLAVLPAGTANVLARELGIPFDLDEAVEVAAEGRVRRISLGQSGDRYFHLMAGIGLDAFIVRNVKSGAKKALGEGAFWLLGFSAFLRYRLDEFELELNGRKHRGTFAVIANAGRYGGNLTITPEADLSEELLDVCIFTSRHKARYASYLWAAIISDPAAYPDVIYEKAREVHVSGPAVPIQMDGEAVGSLPATFSIFEPGIEVMVPRETKTGRRGRAERKS
jgi:diacylglycerol kinase (ATP)